MQQIANYKLSDPTDSARKEWKKHLNVATTYFCRLNPSHLVLSPLQLSLPIEQKKLPLSDHCPNKSRCIIGGDLQKWPSSNSWPKKGWPTFLKCQEISTSWKFDCLAIPHSLCRSSNFFLKWRRRDPWVVLKQKKAFQDLDLSRKVTKKSGFSLN